MTFRMPDSYYEQPEEPNEKEMEMLVDWIYEKILNRFEPYEIRKILTKAIIDDEQVVSRICNDDKKDKP